MGLIRSFNDFGAGSGSSLPADIPDGAHPDQIGYDRMADTWAKAIAATIPVNPAKHP